MAGSEHNIRGLLDSATKLYAVPDFDKEKPPSKQREDELIYLNAQLFTRPGGGIIASSRRHSRGLLSCYFIICYMAVKVLYFLNCLLQIGIIHLLIGARPLHIGRFYHFTSDALETHFLGQFVHKISSGVSELIDTSSFPKRTLCDFTFRELASNHAYTVECILPLNIIVEKMFVFLYIWCIFLAVVILIDFFVWLAHLIRCLLSNDQRRERYVRKHLIDRKRYSEPAIQSFAKKQLSGNTYFLLKLLSKNISTFVVVDMLDYFFKTEASKNKKEN